MFAFCIGQLRGSPARNCRNCTVSSYVVLLPVTSAMDSDLTLALARRVFDNLTDRSQRGFLTQCISNYESRQIDEEQMLQHITYVQSVLRSSASATAPRTQPATASAASVVQPAEEQPWVAVARKGNNRGTKGPRVSPDRGSKGGCGGNVFEGGTGNDDDENDYYYEDEGYGYKGKNDYGYKGPNAYGAKGVQAPWSSGGFGSKGGFAGKNDFGPKGGPRVSPDRGFPGGKTGKGYKGGKNKGGFHRRPIEAQTLEEAERRLETFMRQNPDFVFLPRPGVPADLQAVYDALGERGPQLYKSLRHHLQGPEGDALMPRVLQYMAERSTWRADQLNAREQDRAQRRQYNRDRGSDQLSVVSGFTNRSNRTVQLN